MSAMVLPQKLTPQGYLALERRAETRSEFFNGEMIAMPGTSREHVRIVRNLIVESTVRLEELPFEVLTNDSRVLVERTGLYTYPDMIIVEGEPEYVPDNEFDTLVNPTVLFEVLSPSTASYDRGKKFINYQRIDSLREFVIISQTDPIVERFVRQPDGTWPMQAFMGLDTEFKLATVPLSIPIRRMFRNVTLSVTGRHPSA